MIHHEASLPNVWSGSTEKHYFKPTSDVMEVLSAKINLQWTSHSYGLHLHNATAVCVMTVCVNLQWTYLILGPDVHHLLWGWTELLACILKNTTLMGFLVKILILCNQTIIENSQMKANENKGQGILYMLTSNTWKCFFKKQTNKPLQQNILQQKESFWKNEKFWKLKFRHSLSTCLFMYQYPVSEHGQSACRHPWAIPGVNQDQCLTVNASTMLNVRDWRSLTHLSQTHHRAPIVVITRSMVTLGLGRFNRG